jgi:WXXGXW repeat (2 copies)
LCLVVGCGSSAKKQAADPQQAEREAAAARAKQIEAMQPASPYEVRERKVYRPTDRCGQGPYRFESDSLRAKFGERMVIYACGKHMISGNYRITTTRKALPANSSESTFGFHHDNEACKARELAATSGVASGGGGGAPAGDAKGQHGGATATAPAKVKPVTLEQATSVPEDCVRSSVLDSSWISAEDGIAIDAHFVVDLWSDEPNDLDGLVFVVEKSAADAGMTLERWHAYQNAENAWFKAYMANLDIEVRAGRTRIIEAKVKTPPPPPPRAEVQPPRPSRHARWIPGYWFYEDAKFHWIAGLWDVPEEDVQRALTVQAPTPPPAAPAHDQPTEPQPTSTAVWTPGSWQWDGRAYVWVAGAWRIPPDAEHTWQRATWTVNAGKATFVPGGWRVRVRLGR